MLEHFHPTVAHWFRDRFTVPSQPQLRGWPHIRNGQHTLIAAPTGSGKTLAAFLHALDDLLRRGSDLGDELQVVYVSPLRALANDVQKNLQQPLAEMQELDPTLPNIRVAVRSGDTPQNERAAMMRKPPHILVTTPESLYILTTSVRGRAMLRSTKTLIVDEIHALAASKRGSHFALTCERLDHLASSNGVSLQRIGLSATQRPIEDTAGLLVGQHRDCKIVNVGHLRELDLKIEIPKTPLDTICNGESWREIFSQMQELIASHRTTLVFTNTRKMAERVAARLGEVLSPDRITSHHGSLSKERRLEAEQRLKRGDLQALVTTSSLELGIDVGDVDLVIQLGPTPSIATLLQRVGRAGHAVGKTPKGRLFPLTRDELVTAAALMHAVRNGDLDRTHQPVGPLDILAQQIVAECSDTTWKEQDLFELLTAAHPYRNLDKERFESVLAMHSQGRTALLHRDSIHKTVRGTRRARLTAITCGGAIPEVADWQVVIDDDDTVVGTLHEEFAVESSVGDVFQLGSTSWKIRRVTNGKLRVVDATGIPPSLPFWIAEGPTRSEELAKAVSDVRAHGTDPDWLREQCGVSGSACQQIVDYIREGKEELGAVPTHDTLILERFFDETGGQQLILHGPFGSRINRAFGLALRKKFCTGFGFELQAAANEEAVLVSLGPMHSFPLKDVWSFLHPKTVREVLTQAMLPAPLFQARWRWNVSRSLLIERFRGGKKVPAPLLRFRADDALASAFPAAQACPETLPGGPIEVPFAHPMVAQTVHDSLYEAMDFDGLHALLSRIQDGDIKLLECERSQPSQFAASILHAMPYSFLDDAPLEERRTQAVVQAQRGARSSSQNESESQIDSEALRLVRNECWPEPRNAAELHEALGWMGWLEQNEISEQWQPWMQELSGDGRAVMHESRWFAAETNRDALPAWRGRLEAVIPIWRDELEEADDTTLLSLQAEGVAVIATCEGREFWGHRRLIARVRRALVERLRAAIRPVSKENFELFLMSWQRTGELLRRHGPAGLSDTLGQLAGYSCPAEQWEEQVLPRHLDQPRREWLDQITLSGEFVWLKLWGPWRGPLSKMPVSFVPRKDLHLWLQLPLERAQPEDLSGDALTLYEALQEHGALFPTDLQSYASLLPSHFEAALAELVGLGLISCDSFAAMRQLAIAPSKRRFPLFAVGRWSLLPLPEASTRAGDDTIGMLANALLNRFGVISAALLHDQKVPVPWRLLLRTLRAMELRGEVRGGRFVDGWAGEQYALPNAVAELRRVANTEGLAAT